MLKRIQYPSPVLQKIVEEPDVRFLLARLERHAPHIYHHSLRVAGLFEMLWSDKKLEEPTRTVALRSVLLSDVGYIHIPKDQLEEPHMEHTLIGAEMLESFIKEGRVDRDILLYHHENLDGTGFPYGFNWKSLSPFVQTLRIIDSFDLKSGGIYKEFTVSMVMEELYVWSDIIFDGAWLRRFHRMMNRALETQPTQIAIISQL